MKAVYKNELSTYFTTLTGYIFCMFILLFVGIYTMALCLKQGYSQFEYVLGNAGFIFMIIVPVITMRVLAEEKHQKTDQLLYSLPITSTQVILGKYLALLTVLLIPVAIISVFPLILSAYGEINLAASYCGIFGFYLLGAALLAVGMFISSLTESQMLAAGVCFVVLLINYFIMNIAGVISTAAGTSYMVLMVIAALLAVVLFLMTKNVFVSGAAGIVLLAAVTVFYFTKKSAFEGLVPNIMEKISLFDRFNHFVSNSLNLTDVVFFLSVIGIFLFLSVQSLEKRRWS